MSTAETLLPAVNDGSRCQTSSNGKFWLLGNIPQICKAFILASTTVERQWVQRRGRLLRTCKAINKTYSVIHDFLALPPGMENGLDPDARSLVRSELKRAEEFARLAKNAGRPDGALAIIDKMVNAAYL
ncbi:hypothetical protein [Enhydrobacter sp.]|uniref:hypothetical protein n=1 Tax=Enhydrobacter sp. TaxID=1894999 RepID=UPI00260449C2|nr:hypothetical protein [Enhydrobacter sp.]